MEHDLVMKRNEGLSRQLLDDSPETERPRAAAPNREEDGVRLHNQCSSADRATEAGRK